MTAMDQPAMPLLTLIPARGGSKSIPRKNLKPLGGHPLIAWSIAAALQAECKPRVIVSTDDEEIATVAREYGAEVPFMRPAELAQDRTLDLPVFQHALGWLEEKEGYLPGIVIQLRPTSPFRPAGMIDEAVRILRAHPEATSVRGEHRTTVELPERTLVWEGRVWFRSDRENFFYSYTRRLLENGELVREKSWEDVIPRDHQ
jgi:CMP-N-acetylneuraminic acid synthetase